jgi:conjugal transfer pilus assembly protein TraW
MVGLPEEKSVVGCMVSSCFRGGCDLMDWTSVRQRLVWICGVLLVSLVPMVCGWAGTPAGKAMNEIARQADRVTGEGSAPADSAAVSAGAQAVGGAAPPVGMPQGLEAATSAAAVVREPAAGRGVAAAHDAIASAKDRDLVLFVSSAMGQPALQQALREAAADGHTRVVVRGALPGERYGGEVRPVAPLLSGKSPPPWIDFDPPSFRKAGVEDVPTIWDPATGSKWRGSVALTAFRRRLGEAATTFAESVGPATPVAELDPEDFLKAQVARFDFDTVRQRAYQGYWRRVALAGLPLAKKSATRTVDPALWLSEPPRDAGSRVAVDAGAGINPLEMYPWARQLVVFDATNPVQMAWAVLRARFLDGPSIFLTTDVDREAGWDGWQRLLTALGKPLFLLDATLAKRIDVHVVPSVVYREGAALHVSERSPSDMVVWGAPLLAQTAMFLASAPPGPCGQPETASLTPNEAAIPDGQR